MGACCLLNALIWKHILKVGPVIQRIDGEMFTELNVHSCFYTSLYWCISWFCSSLLLPFNELVGIWIELTPQVQLELHFGIGIYCIIISKTFSKCNTFLEIKCASSLIHKIWRCSHIYYYSTKFHRENLVILIDAIKNLCEGDLYVDLAHVQADQQLKVKVKVMSCTSFDIERFLPAKFCLNFTNVIISWDQ